MRGKKETSIHKDPAFIKIYVPIAHDEETELDVWDVDFAYNEFANAIKEFENDNDMRYDEWNSKQRDYANDSRTDEYDEKNTWEHLDKFDNSHESE